jgi:Condensation domain
MSRPSITLPLNHTEHGYVALEGLAGSMGVTYFLQFDQPVDTAHLRAVVREMVSACPRFRGVVEPLLQRYQLRILDDGDTTDQLFEHAWRELPHLDADNMDHVQALMQQLLNEVLPLERGLACRFHVIPHEQHPALFITVHHLLFDGRSALTFMADLIARLNGGPPIRPQLLDAPSHLAAIAPMHWWQWPAKLLRSRANAQQQAAFQAGVTVQQAAPQAFKPMSTHMVKLHTVPGTTQEWRALAKRLGLSFNGLVTLALTEAFLSYAPQDPKAAAIVRMSVDLRRYYPEQPADGMVLMGNHVGAFLVNEVGPKPLAERAASIKNQIDEGLARFERRENLWAQWPMFIAPYLGRGVLSRLVLDMYRKARMPRISVHATSLGNVSGMVPQGAAIRLKHFSFVVPSLSTLHAVTELDGRLSMPVIWQRCDASPEEMSDYLSRVDQAFANLRVAASRWGM